MIRDILAAVMLALIVGTVGFLFIRNIGATGPNCPPPVPSNWIGFCADYEIR